MPSGPGVLSDQKIAEIIDELSADIGVWVLTSKASGQEIVDQLNLYKPKKIQLVDQIPLEDYSLIRKHHPEVEIVQVIHVEGKASLDLAKSVDPFVDAILLDSGNPQALARSLGGTGQTHDWAFSREIVDSVRSDVYLAGGLKPANITSAIGKVKPYGVDACSGLRVDGSLEKDLLKSFMANMARAIL
jgi:phosphoribosylanthranilate isomerase